MARKVNLLIIPLIFSILIIIGLIVAIVSMDSTITEEKKAAKIAKRAVDREKTLNYNLMKRIKIDAIWTVGETAEAEVATIATTLLSFESDGKIKEFLKEVLNLKGTNVRHNNLAAAITALVEERRKLIAILTQRLAETDGLRRDVQKTNSQHQEAKEEFAKELKKHLATIDEKVREYEQLRADFEQSKVDLNAEIAKLKEEIDRMSTEFQMREAMLQSLADKFKSRIAEIVKKEGWQKETYMEKSPPDGEVIHAEFKLGKAWIDLGRINDMRPGMGFLVYHEQKGGLRLKKGMIEVVKVSDTQSEVIVTNLVNEKEPIVSGDYIISPFYDKDSVPVFVFLGELINKRSYSQRDIEKMINDLGGKVEPGVTVKTRYIIAGKGAADEVEEYEKAKLFGCIFLPEILLFEYLGK